MANNALEKDILEQSIVLLKKIYNDLNNEYYEEIEKYYHSVHRGIKSFKKSNANINKPETPFGTKIAVVEQKDKEILNIIENQNWSAAPKLINQLYIQFTDLIQFVDHKDLYIKYKVNTFSKYFEYFDELGYYHNIRENLDIKKVQKYWRKYFYKNIDPSLHIAYANVYGDTNPRLIHQYEFNELVLPELTPLYFNGFYSDKNVYDLLITSEHHPENVLKRVNGQYFNEESNTISREEALHLYNLTKEDIIAKKSYANDGHSVDKLKYIDNVFYHNNNLANLNYLEEHWGEDFILQKVIKQHDIMAAPHKDSVNTLRMVTLRWGDKIHYLLTYARFGSDGSAKDNGGEGGICVGVSPEGYFKSFGIGHKGQVIYTHPSTGYDFSNLGKVPNFDKCVAFVKQLHDRILHHNYVSWDIAIGKKGEPIFIEMNFRGPVWKYQLANEQSLFGDLTEEVLEHAARKIQNKKNNSTSVKDD
ncbi:sugar-transfer associated ATP-grasp domain-containing protein [Alkalibacillus salilacus]|uniref:Alpha-L-glutamate ligase-related protein ATP-grasp domain-containing protein n=1 Tax=Alkalibacillus salilacus TaxID=284582 RepID=A0ABT9VF99_9BACI|nr:sugar-transfer associated ATP-grasp domain-containing protein [Alkalibacillus salilacus]MDQ0159652.1 hypothetical protein [Alkalibacillus salilacus]